MLDSETAMQGNLGKVYGMLKDLETQIQVQYRLSSEFQPPCSKEVRETGGQSKKPKQRFKSNQFQSPDSSSKSRYLQLYEQGQQQLEKR